MRHRLVVSTVFALLAGCAGQARPDKTGAPDAAQAQPVAATLDAFLAQMIRIEEGFAAGGRYEFIGAAERERVRAMLLRMGKALQVAGSVDAMSDAAQAELLADQQQLDILLRRHDSSQLSCEQRAPTGSNIPVSICRRYGGVDAPHSYLLPTLDRDDAMPRARGARSN